MMDDSETPGNSAETNANPTDAGVRVGFCQECGRSLTAPTLRRVGNGVFCVPCSTQRQTSNAWQSVNVGSYPGANGPGANGSGAPPIPPADPNPAIAGCLGFIPGVGAMYNGQYAKGAMHLVVFVVLVALADNLNWVFYWLVWGWVFYQAFDAYHTARARREGLPLPNPFGWNDIGERLGAHRTSPPVPAAGSPSFPTSRSAGANWAGYVPPRETARPAYPPVTEPPSQNPYTAYAAPGPRPVSPPYVPYAPTYTASVPSQTTTNPPPPLGATRRLPGGALWLIGLGIVFLMGNLQPEWRLSGRWLVPFLLAALAVWGALRRWDTFRANRLVVAGPQNLAGAMAGPAMLFTVAVLLAFQAGHVVSLHRSWPVLLVVWGGVLLMQRTAPSPVPLARTDVHETVPQPVRSTSGTGSLGL